MSEQNCGKSFESVCNRPSGHKGGCYFEPFLAAQPSEAAGVKLRDSLMENLCNCVEEPLKLPLHEHLSCCPGIRAWLIVASAQPLTPNAGEVRRQALEEAAQLAEKHCCGCCCDKPHVPKRFTGDEPCEGYFDLPAEIRALAASAPAEPRPICISCGHEADGLVNGLCGFCGTGAAKEAPAGEPTEEQIEKFLSKRNLAIVSIDTLKMLVERMTLGTGANFMTTQPPAPSGEGLPKPENLKWLLDSANQVIKELGKQEHLDSDTFRWLCNAVGQVERDLKRAPDKPQPPSRTCEHEE